MKARCDFVSNSSSSSFIVISDKGEKKVPNFEGESLFVPCDYGCKSFQWQTERYYDFYSKLNWCAIIIMSLKDQERYDKSSEKLEVDVTKPWFKSSEMANMLTKVCKERFGLSVEIAHYSETDDDDKQLDEYYDIGGIDHQSNVGESPENARMFMTEKSLYDFLSNSHSFIDNSNDNGGRDSEFDEAKNMFVFNPPIPGDYEE